MKNITFSNDKPLQYAFVTSISKSILFFANKPDLKATKKANTEWGYTNNPFDGTTGNYYPVFFRSLTKEMSEAEAIENGYWIPGISFFSNKFSFEKDKVICQVEKWQNKKGWTNEMIQKEVQKAWENNSSFSSCRFQTRID
jgi:hypothetical protein